MFFSLFVSLCLAPLLVETLEQKIISLELTKSSDETPLDEEREEIEKEEREEDATRHEEVEEYDTETTASEPATPTVEDKPIVNVSESSATNTKKKRRKKTKKGKHWDPVNIPFIWLFYHRI